MKSNISSHPENRFAKKLIEIYETKGMAFTVLTLWNKVKDKPQRLGKYMNALRDELEKRDDIDKVKFTEELISAIGITNGTGKLHTDSGNEASQPENEDEPTEVEQSSGGPEAGKETS